MHWLPYLNIVPVNDATNALVDLQVSSTTPAAGLEPWSQRRFSDDVCPLREDRTDLCRESNDPVFCGSATTVECVEILVVDIDTLSSKPSVQRISTGQRQRIPSRPYSMTQLPIVVAVEVASTPAVVAENDGQYLQGEV